ncbi:hypothetical protein BS47DRAFT_1364784 [Hydnum rufescens UP504]|uniref:Mug135-like C-terminal domain-containing protein n=1 Tax=Hydnum rufescens UP504 TaxID=1448309 RepID=A0A9P6DT14_9AGAM|nr:hypothetical protein BS47DRAFT_1364784 [Hydnum rufescens UP504]
MWRVRVLGGTVRRYRSYRVLNLRILSLRRFDSCNDLAIVFVFLVPQPIHPSWSTWQELRLSSRTPTSVIDARWSTNTVTRAVAMGGNQAIAPAWFAPVQQLLNNMQQEVTHIEQGCQARQGLINAQNDGQIFPFALVLSNDGTDPTQEPFHNLPAVTSIRAINRLTLEQCDQYLERSGVNIPVGNCNLTHQLIDRACERKVPQTKHGHPVGTYL